MNCLQFRRALATDLKALGDPERAHAQTCVACAQHARRVAIFERRLEAATNVAVPEHLRERILLRHAFRANEAKRLRWPAAAAVLLLLIGGAVAALTYIYHDEALLEHEVIALVEAAEHALAARGPVATLDLASALRPVGLRIDGPVGLVSFAGRCLVRGKLAGHVVLRDQDRPITVFLMPDESLLRTSRFEDKNWSAVLVPAENGVIGIVAPRGYALDPVMRRVLDAVRWPA